ncbi:MAG: restriction endonuclease subunit S [Prolixibacteraceae bacterium]|nr:restriction endonuclease subunit S [Prolixibacteraceae bacterium]
MMKFIDNKKSWENVSFGDLVVKKEEKERDAHAAGYTKFLKVEHFDKGSLHIKRWGLIGEDELPPTFYKVFRKGQLLYPTRNPHLQRAALAEFDGICGEKTLTLEPLADKVLPSFLPFLMQSSLFIAHTTNFIVGSTNPHVRWRDVAKLKFKLPPLPEQKRLADLLWSLDETIGAYWELVYKLKNEFQVTLEDSIKKPISPSSWLGDFVKIEKGLTYGSDDYGDKKSGNILINLKCFEKFGGFNKEGIKFYIGEYSEKHKLYKNDLIIANTDITRNGDVAGFPVLVPDFGDEIVLFTMDVSKLVIKNKSMLGAYLFYLLRTQWAHWYMYAHSPGTTVLHLDLSSVPKLPIPKVSLDEQRHIINKLQAVENGIQKYKDLILIIEQYQKQLINQIFG